MELRQRAEEISTSGTASMVTSMEAGRHDAWEADSSVEPLEDLDNAFRKASTSGKSWGNLMSALHQANDDGGNRTSNYAKRRMWLHEHVSKWKLPRWLVPRITFYRIHFTVFFVVMMIGTLIIYVGPRGIDGPLTFIDCMYLATSSLCCVGLVSVSMLQLSSFGKVVLMFLMLIGNQVMTSLIPVLVRRHYYKKALEREGIFELESIAPSVLGTHEDRMKEVENVPPIDEGGESLHLARSASEHVAGSTLQPSVGTPGGDRLSQGQASEESRRGSGRVDEGSLRGLNSERENSMRGHSARGGEGSLLGVPVDREDSVRSIDIDAAARARALQIDIDEEGSRSGRISGHEGSLRHRREDDGSLRGGLRSHESSMRNGVREGDGSVRYGVRDGDGSFRGRSPGARTPSARMGAGTPKKSGGGPKRLPSASNLFGPLGDLDDDHGERATATWAGDTAQINARRLKALLEVTKQQGTSRTPVLPAGPGFFHRRAGADEDSAIDAAALVPGERRFIELRALELLSWLVPVYFFGFQLGAFILLFLSIRVNPFYMGILNTANVSPVFMAAFQAVTGFNNSGMSLLDDNLVSFQAYLPYLLIVMVLILAGNTMYAPTLRFLLIIISKWGNPSQRFVSRYLLDHPRKCYTHLFPPDDSRWLIVSVLLFNTTEFVFFCALDWNTAALEGLSPQVKVLDGIFQSVSTRMAGFNVISISLLSYAMLFMYCGMMYIAVYPVYITRQRSREQREVYDDEDLQIFYEDLEEGVMDKGVLGQGKRMFTRDSALLFLSIFLVCIAERSSMDSDPTNFSVFNIIFEMVSAYGNVGLSLGYSCPVTNPDCVGVPYSFSGTWNAVSKFMVIMIMFLGRHRGLPDDIDAAIVLPDKKRFRRDIPQVQDDDTQLLLGVTSTMSLSKAQSAQAASLLRQLSSAANKSPAANANNEIRVVSGENTECQ